MTAPNTIQEGTDNGALLVFLRNEEAQAVAKLCTRLSRGRATQFRLADSKDEARTMMAGLDAIRNVLLEHGFGNLKGARALAHVRPAAPAFVKVDPVVDEATGDLFDLYVKAGKA
jgi:hypothetical protein